MAKSIGGCSLKARLFRRGGAAASTACTFLLLFVILGCNAQEAPFYTTKSFAKNVTHRTDMCQRQRQLFADEILLPDALQGLNLSVVFVNYQDPGSQPFFTLREGVISDQDPPLLAVIMDELALRAGFEWRNSYGVVDPIDSDGEINSQDNQTWSDLLEWTVSTYDISAGKWDKSVDRMRQEVSFPEGWYDSSTILVESTSGSDNTNALHPWSFLLPFQWVVWVTIVVTVVISGFVYFVLERLNFDADEREIEHDASAAVFYSFITMTGHFEFRPQTTAARLFLFSLTFFALLIASAYTANLVSFLVVRITPSFQLQSVEQAVVMGVPICVQDKVSIDEHLSSRYPNAVLLRKPTPEQVFSGVVRGECLVAAVPVSSFDMYERDSEINPGCTLRWHGRVERIIPAGMATVVDTGVSCSSLISYVLDYHLSEMKSGGFLERTWNEFLAVHGDQTCVDTGLVDLAATGDSSIGDGSQEAPQDMNSLNIQEMAGIFITHAVLMMLSVLIAVFSYWKKKSLARKTPTDACQEVTDDSPATDKLIPGSESETLAAQDSPKQLRIYESDPLVVEGMMVSLNGGPQDSSSNNDQDRLGEV